MKKNLSFVVLLLILFFSMLSIISAQHKFYVDLNDRTDEAFKVTLIPDKLTDSNKIFQFAATAPGTYEIMDIGRFVKSFTAFDKAGNEITVTHPSVDQWEIFDPENVNKIVYEISDTWDTQVDKNPVYPMCGSEISDDYVMINGQCVFGYFHNMQKYPVEIKLEYPNNWIVGTALEQNGDGFYTAPDYDTIVDSPILVGDLTKASTTVDNTIVDVYTHSKGELIKSGNILMTLEDVLDATDQFTMGLPVNRYVFLFNFVNFSAGAWEHNYSSIYVYKNDTLTDHYAKELRSTAAHEFFHIITPLHIHSELVENFNYERPVMSQHLWLYEGVTEWASRIMQLRDYLISLDDYLDDVKQKLTVNDGFDQDISLTELGKKSTELQDQYFNIYNKGAVVAGLLDIRLLKLSNAKKGLRELLLDLLNEYGINKSISEDNFFNSLAAETYPEIGDFIKDYIQGTKPLPIKEYFGWLGIDYSESEGYDSSKITLGFGIGFKDNHFIVSKVNPRIADKLQSGDILYKVDNDLVTFQNIQSKAASLQNLKVGDKVNITVKKDGKEIEVELKALPREIRHKFTVLDNPLPEQLALRNAWMKNNPDYKVK